jgi:hypothetical protein
LLYAALPGPTTRRVDLLALGVERCADLLAGPLRMPLDVMQIPVGVVQLGADPVQHLRCLSDAAAFAAVASLGSLSFAAAKPMPVLTTTAHRTATNTVLPMRPPFRSSASGAHPHPPTRWVSTDNRGGVSAQRGADAKSGVCRGRGRSRAEPQGPSPRVSRGTEGPRPLRWEADPTGQPGRQLRLLPHPRSSLELSAITVKEGCLVSPSAARHYPYQGEGYSSSSFASP